jgi:hypothetical protein
VGSATTVIGGQTVDPADPSIPDNEDPKVEDPVAADPAPADPAAGVPGTPPPDGKVPNGKGKGKGLLRQLGSGSDQGN